MTYLGRLFQRQEAMPSRIHHEFVATTAALVGAGIAAAGAIGSGAMASSAAKSAAKTQADAATKAQQGQAEALQFSKDQFAKQQENLAPWLASGKGALDKLQSFIDSGGGAKYDKTFQGPADFSYDKFIAPNGVDFKNDPGYQFRIDQAQKGILRGAAAGGGAFTGGTLQAIADKSGLVASDEYSKVFDRAAQTYASNFNNALSGYKTNFDKNLTTFNSGLNQFNNDQASSFNRLQALSGGGLSAVNSANAESQRLSDQNAQTASNIGELGLQSANATSAGQVASGNAWGNAVKNIGAGFVPGGGYASLLTRNRLPASGSIYGGVMNDQNGYG